MNKISAVIFAFLLINSCDMGKDQTFLKNRKAEIIKTEAAFAAMAKKDGIQVAFLHFAATDAVLNRQNKLYKGKAAIEDYFDSQKLPFTNMSLEWTPDFVELSESGDLAYTYGNYSFFYTDSLGEKQTDKGIFHTVWKRQNDGNWLYVWD